MDGKLVHTFIKAFLCLAPFGVMQLVIEVLPSQSLHAHRENCASNEYVHNLESASSWQVMLLTVDTVGTDRVGAGALYR